MPDCLFCKPEGVIVENNFVYGKFDKFPVTKGHALVIPKRHVLSFFELREEELQELYDALCRLKEKIDKEHHPDGYNVGINDGEAAGRTIHHLHVHLIPRYKGDVEAPAGGVRHIVPGKGSCQREDTAARDE